MISRHSADGMVQNTRKPDHTYHDFIMQITNSNLRALARKLHAYRESTLLRIGIKIDM
jgi:hypothetical protein